MGALGFLGVFSCVSDSDSLFLFFFSVSVDLTLVFDFSFGSSFGFLSFFSFFLGVAVVCMGNFFAFSSILSLSVCVISVAWAATSSFAPTVSFPA